MPRTARSGAARIQSLTAVVDVRLTVVTAGEEKELLVGQGRHTE